MRSITACRQLVARFRARRRSRRAAVELGSTRPRGTPSAGRRAGSSSSAVGPWNRISPFSMKYAVSATVSATFTDCSTRMIVVPCSRSSTISGSSCSTITGASPSDSSSIISSRGLRQERHAEREHLLLAAGEVRRRARRWRSASTGNSSSTRSMPSLDRRLVVAVQPRATRRFSATVSAGTRPARRAPDDAERRRSRSAARG